MIALIKKLFAIFPLIVLTLIIHYSTKSILLIKEGGFNPAKTRIPLSASILRITSLNNDLSTADLLYLKALIYTGESLNTSDTYWLFTYYDTITELDPRFELAYILGGINISVFCYNGELSNRILLKGLRVFQNNWRIPFLIGYNYYYELGDFLSGAKYIEMASKLPGAPYWLSMLASRLYSTAGDIDTAIEFLKNLISITDNKKLRNELKRTLKIAIIERYIRPIEEAVKKYQKLYGRPPEKIDELIKAGLMEKIPREPFGGYFYIDQEGNVWSSTIKERFKIYVPEDLGWKLKKESN